MCGKHGRDLADPGGQARDHAGLRGVSVDHIGIYAAEQRDGFSESAQVIERAHAVAQMRNDVTADVHAARFLKQESILARRDFDFAAVAESTDQVEDVDLRSAAIGACDKVENLQRSAPAVPSRWANNNLYKRFGVRNRSLTVAAR